MNFEKLKDKQEKKAKKLGVYKHAVVAVGILEILVWGIASVKIMELLGVWDFVYSFISHSYFLYYLGNVFMAGCLRWIIFKGKHEKLKEFRRQAWKDKDLRKEISKEKSTRYVILLIPFFNSYYYLLFLHAVLNGKAKEYLNKDYAHYLDKDYTN